MGLVFAIGYVIPMSETVCGAPCARMARPLGITLPGAPESAVVLVNIAQRARLLFHPTSTDDALPIVHCVTLHIAHCLTDFENVSTYINLNSCQTHGFSFTLKNTFLRSAAEWPGFPRLTHIPICFPHSGCWCHDPCNNPPRPARVPYAFTFSLYDARLSLSPSSVLPFPFGLLPLAFAYGTHCWFCHVINVGMPTRLITNTFGPHIALLTIPWPFICVQR